MGKVEPFKKASKGWVILLYWVKSSAVLLWLSGCALIPGSGAFDWNAPADERVWAHLGERGDAFLVDGKNIEASPWLSPFYRRRAGQLAWSGGRGPLARADELIGVLRQAREDGLHPADYRLAAIEAALAQWRGAGGRRVSLVELDLLLSNAFLRYAAHLQRGRIRPQRIHPEWQVGSPQVDLGSLLQTVLALNQVRANLEGLRPSQAGYTELRRVLGEYHRIAAQGGWPRLGDGTRWRRGQRSAVAEVLRRRLLACGDLESGVAADHRELDLGLRRFQRRHGLEESGGVDRATLEALNVPVEERIAQIELNMERWRWLPHHPGTRYILVRIADFELDVVEDDEVVLNMRVIVGKPYWRTPIFSSSMTQLVFNPSWYIPESIAVEEILPLVRRDFDYLEARNIRVVQGRGDSARVVAADSIDWAGIQSEKFPYSFIQAPGEGNPLGRVKFLFPNPFAVYLHDTPDGALFSQTKRAFSHGCIRLEKSLELATYVVRGKAGWGRDRVESAVESALTRRVPLANPLPVYLLYWTVWVDEDGGVQFRRDLYDADQKLRQALQMVAINEEI